MKNQIISPHHWQRKKKNNKKMPIKNKNTKKVAGFDKKKAIKYSIVFVVVLFMVGVFSLIGVFAWVSKDLPEPGKLQDRVLVETTKIYDRSGKHLLYEIHGDKNRTFIPLEKIPDNTKLAFIALEDKNFFQHKGLSIKHIIKSAFLYGLKKIGLYHGLVPGGSTLTQQFVKNSILTNEKTISRKFKEWILAYQIEKKYTKEQILELYFNEIPFGSTSYGIEAAAQNYFGKPAEKLNLAESALLAAMIQRPTYYSPFGSHVDELFKRQQFVLNEMVDMGFIEKDEAEVAKNFKPEFKQALSNIQAPHFVLYVKELLTQEYGERMVEQGGLKVYTTLDYDKQKIAEEAINKFTPDNEKKWGATNAALVSLDPKTGEILAMVGSRDFFNKEIDGQVNIALSKRQPGSSFKPIVYTAAWAAGYYPETIVFDVITKFKTDTGKIYEPHNYDGKEHGPVSLLKAMQGSLNIPAVKTIYLVGVNKVIDLAEKLGYSTFSNRSRFGLSLVLGGGEVKLLEHVAAFGALAREGLYQKPVAILKVEDNKGGVLQEFKPRKGERVIDSKIARITNYSLSDDNARSYAFGAGSLLTLPGRPVAAKTGTTNDYRDAWTVGYTPSIVTGVWVGNNNNKEMKSGASGYRVATPIWNFYMKKVLVNTPVEIFKTPKYELPDKPMLGGSIGEEIKVTINKDNGLLATDQTPLEKREEKIYRKLHSILYFVDKNNPLGPEPGESSTDPQFEIWEDAIKKWAEKEGVEINEEPPTEYDDTNNEENKPNVSILKPVPDEKIDRNTNIKISYEAKNPLQKIEIYLDDILQTTRINDFVSPVNIPLTIGSDFKKGFHYLKVVVYDEKGNNNLNWHRIEVK